MKNYKYDLSIVVITMNRQEQLIQALNSCIKCVLPPSTNFIIIDNASSDNTENCVKEFFKNNKFEYKYKKLNQNKGVGGGRNIGFDEADGKFIYFMDDDAIIAEECYESFFIDAIKFLDENSNVATLTTKITDELLKYDRKVAKSKYKSISGYPVILSFLGGSHFLRRDCFKSPLYLDIKYGNEEIVPSLYSMDNGFYNVYYDKIRVIHKPRKNKWVTGRKIHRKIVANEAATKYATKILLYPRIFKPLLFIAYVCRCYKHSRNYNYKDLYKKSNKLARTLIKNNKMKKLRIYTVLEIIKDYGIKAF